MRENSNLVLESGLVKLVPYRAEHVAQYHLWMEDPLIREATASEQLSLEEEFTMQKSWAEDTDKCTFIILDPAHPDTPGTGEHGGGMAGDVNLFFNDLDDATGTVEIEVMVAEPRSRRKGIAAEALLLIMAYAFCTLGVCRFQAKIGFANTASLALFSKLGYIEIKRSEIFEEATLELYIDDKSASRYRETWRQAKKTEYE